MTDVQRRTLFLCGGVALFLFLLWGLRGLPAFGRNHERLGLALLTSAPTRRHALDVVTAINFDYRGMDTLGEEFILYAAVAGVSLLLRTARAADAKEGDDAAGGSDAQEEESCETLPAASDAVRALAAGLIILTLFYGLYIVLLAHLSLGGGFQGGVVLATAWLLAYLAGGDSHFHRISREKGLDLTDALGAGGYAVIGLAALLSGAAFLQNVLPLGKTGNVNSTGTIPVINFAVSMEVTAGFVLLFREFIKVLEQKTRQEAI